MKKQSMLGALRLVFQVAIVVMAAVTGFRHALGWSRTSVETYCPFGGLEAAYALVTEGQFTCATGERNLALFLGLLILTLLTRKSFCGWICPLGAVSEWFATLGVKWFGKRRRDPSGGRLHAFEPPRKIDRALRWLRWLVLGVLLFFTYKTGELVFRGYDPYYILFSFHGHDVKVWSYFILGLLLAGVVLVPMAWCRYLCPLGAVLWPFSRVAGMRLVRSASSCSGCMSCQRSCPQGLDPAKSEAVLSGDCTLCFKCVDACAEKSFDLRLGGPKQ